MLQERDPQQLLGSLQRALQARQAPVEHALFVPLDSSSFTVQASAGHLLAIAAAPAQALLW